MRKQVVLFKAYVDLILESQSNSIAIAYFTKIRTSLDRIFCSEKGSSEVWNHTACAFFHHASRSVNNCMAPRVEWIWEWSNDLIVLRRDEVIRIIKSETESSLRSLSTTSDRNSRSLIDLCKWDLQTLRRAWRRWDRCQASHASHKTTERAISVASHFPRCANCCLLTDSFNLSRKKANEKPDYRGLYMRLKGSTLIF